VSRIRWDHHQIPHSPPSSQPYVHGTPMSGKTILSELLHSYVRASTKFTTVHMVWLLKDHRQWGTWIQYVCDCSEGASAAESLYIRRDVILIIDEA